MTDEGMRLSAAIDDPAVCKEMKAAIEALLSAAEEGK